MCRVEYVAVVFVVFVNWITSGGGSYSQVDSLRTDVPASHA